MESVAGDTERILRDLVTEIDDITNTYFSDSRYRMGRSDMPALMSAVEHLDELDRLRIYWEDKKWR